MTALLLVFYVLTVAAIYGWVKLWRPRWQFLAELTAMVGGVAAWVLLGAYVATL